MTGGTHHHKSHPALCTAGALNVCAQKVGIGGTGSQEAGVEGLTALSPVSLISEQSISSLRPSSRAIDVSRETKKAAGSPTLGRDD